MLLAKITGDVKLVGSTINCGPGPPPADVIGAAAHGNPHVQSYLVATDRDGLRILEEDGRVFRCHETMVDTIHYAEQGSALAIMGAGYNLDCLMLRYQGVDWRDRHNWNCNRGVNPYIEDSNDGMNISPLEAMFVKVKGHMLDSRASAAEVAAKYSEWITDQDLQGQADVIKNDYLDNIDRFTIARVLYTAARGSQCFDMAFYRDNNPDVQAVAPDAASMWLHYVTEGQFEGRAAIFHCPPAFTTMMSIAKNLTQDINPQK